MHHLGVRTTRALSLVVSGKEKVARPWFSEGQQIPTVDDPRIAHLPLKTREHLIKQLATQKVWFIHKKKLIVFSLCVFFLFSVIPM
jgi:hypothetical protein